MFSKFKKGLYFLLYLKIFYKIFQRMLSFRYSSLNRFNDFLFLIKFKIFPFLFNLREKFEEAREIYQSPITKIETSMSPPLTSEARTHC